MQDLDGFNPYDDRTREAIGKHVDARIQNKWFENYEKNLPYIKRWGGIVKDGKPVVPLSKRFVVVGAGWPLWDGAYARSGKLGTEWTTLRVQGNLHYLKDVECPIIVCDKISSQAAMYCKPFAVTALNTGETDVRDWLDKFEVTMNEQWGPEALEEVWMIVPVTINPEALEGWRGKIAFINPQNTCDELCLLVQEETGIEPTARGDNVGYFSIVTAISLGAMEIAVIGMPLAYPTEEAVMKVTHGKHCVTLYDEVLRGYIYTTFDWLDSRRELIELIGDFRDRFKVKVVNCTGAGILYQANVIEPLPFSEWVKYARTR